MKHKLDLLLKEGIGFLQEESPSCSSTYYKDIKNYTGNKAISFSPHLPSDKSNAHIINSILFFLFKE